VSTEENTMNLSKDLSVNKELFSGVSTEENTEINKVKINKNILNIIVKGTKGNIILKELIEYIFNPIRLSRLAILYNINVDVLLSYY
jgi:hypothetical protein